MSNIIYHRRWAAIPLDLLLNPNASLEAKVLAGLILQLTRETTNCLILPDR